jgi:MFS family permease
MNNTPAPADLSDSRYACWRLVIALLAMLMGSSCMFVVAVVLPEVQAEFGVSRSDATLPYTLMMIGFGIGGVYMGKLADRFGVTISLLIGSAGILIGFIWAGLSTSIMGFGSQWIPCVIRIILKSFGLQVVPLGNLGNESGAC